jgi:glycosyltransferase involved in cell wall biosynthesis
VDRPGDNGMLVPAADVPKLADGMRDLHRDEGLRRRLARGARVRVEEEYTLERMVSRTLDVYETAVGRARGNRPPPAIPLPSAAG